MAVRPAPLPPGFFEDQSSLAAWVRALRALGARHRRLLAALCAGASVFVAVSALMPTSPAPGEVSAPKGSAAGSSLPAVLPSGAGALAAGDAERVAVTVRLADPAGLLLLRVGAHAEVLAGPPPDGGVPNPGGEGTGEVLAPDAVVLAVPAALGRPGADADGSGVDSAGGLLAGVGGQGQSGQAAGMSSGLDGVVLLAVQPSDARRLAAAAGSRSLSVAVGLPGTAGSAP
jgi:hypothetical protein